jgi:drug/metabolite transporter (DMT)-like permease
MTWLVLCIVLSALLFAGFKWFDIKKVNLLMAISGNYISCIVTGLLIGCFSGESTANYHAFDMQTAGICMGLGCLFFAVFYSMGYASARIGVGITSASTKMSLVIPVFYNAIALGESLYVHQVFALVFSLAAVVLMSFSPGEKPELKQLLLPFMIFIGSGIVDLSINMLRMETEGRHFNSGTSVILIFSGAICAASFIVLGFNRHLLKDLRSLGFGLLLGIPNYLSIVAMMKALGSGHFSFNTFYMVNNTAVMLLCFLLGLLLFGEKLSWTKAAGLLLAILSIYLILAVH